MASIGEAVLWLVAPLSQELCQSVKSHKMNEKHSKSHQKLKNMAKKDEKTFFAAFLKSLNRLKLKAYYCLNLLG
ncbi:MAG: hypothetical protein ACKOWX_01525, partial [Flavobacteriales bacterium]